MFCVPFSLCDKCVYWLNFLTEYELKSIGASIFCFNDVNHSHHYICFDLHFFPSLEHTLWFIIACMTTKTIKVSDMVSLQCNFFVRLNLKRTIWYEGFDPDSFLSNVIDLVTQNAFMETSLLFILYFEVNKICSKSGNWIYFAAL